MAEYIERDKVLFDIEEAMKFRGLGYVFGSELKRYIKRQPAADVVEVVRCKNCRESCYISQMFGESLFCAYWKKDTDEDGYCHEGV